MSNKYFTLVTGWIEHIEKNWPAHWKQWVLTSPRGFSGSSSQTVAGLVVLSLADAADAGDMVRTVPTLGHGICLFQISTSDKKLRDALWASSRRKQAVSSVLQVGRRRWVSPRWIRELCLGRRVKTGSFRDALSRDAEKTDARDAWGDKGNDKGGSQLLSL